MKYAWSFVVFSALKLLAGVAGWRIEREFFERRVSWLGLELTETESRRTYLRRWVDPSNRSERSSAATHLEEGYSRRDIKNASEEGQLHVRAL